ncbi:hypothetical protein ACFCXS_27870 [Streptomyces sp. NPDC056373]|uniref:hypothetical protein n=1 Tax=Streptomyces sp. NPDC056373 TaxID=3345798 RepID=UPI0035DEE4D7
MAFLLTDQASSLEFLVRTVLQLFRTPRGVFPDEQVLLGQLLAELIHASGSAIVVSGLVMAQAAPRLVRDEHRPEALAFWPLVTFIIDGAYSSWSVRNSLMRCAT